MAILLIHCSNALGLLGESRGDTDTLVLRAAAASRVLVPPPAAPLPELSLPKSPESSAKNDLFWLCLQTPGAVLAPSCWIESFGVPRIDSQAQILFPGNSGFLEKHKHPKRSANSCTLLAFSITSISFSERFCEPGAARLLPLDKEQGRDLSTQSFPWAHPHPCSFFRGSWDKAVNA